MNGDRRGMTLTEVVVFVGVFSFFAILLLPAMHRARSESRRVECLRNMREIATAINQSTELNGMYPAAGWWDAPTGGIPIRSWVVDLLPYLGRDDIYRQWDLDVTYRDMQTSNNGKLAETPLEVLVCPDDDTVVPGRGNLSYALNHGFAFSSGRDCPTAYHHNGWVKMDVNGDGKICTDQDREIMKLMGVFFLQSWPRGNPRNTVRYNTPADITDGRSTTIMLSENIRTGSSVSRTNWASPWAGNCVFFGSGHICPGGDCSRLNFASANDHSTRPAADEAINAGLHLRETSPWLSSLHPGRGVNLMFCDGGGRFLSEKVSGTVYAKLITPAGEKLSGRLEQKPLGANEF